MWASADQTKSQGRVSAIFAETPVNPNNSITDIQLLSKLADHNESQQGLRP